MVRMLVMRIGRLHYNQMPGRSEASLGIAVGVGLLLALASGCASQSTGGFAHYEDAHYERCSGAKVEVCHVAGASRLKNTQQLHKCTCRRLN